MIKPIKILNDLITNLNHVVKVSNVVNNGDGTFTLTVENTYYLTINKIITINNVDYKIVDFELNSWIKIAGTITPNVTSFQINSPKFVHGTPKMVNVENSFNNDYPFIWLVEFTEVDYNNDYAVNLTAKLDLNLLFLTDINYEDWLIKDHYINAIYPMANEIDFIINALNKRKDLFADIDNYKVINHVNFGDYVTNKGYDSKILTDQLSGCQLKLTLPYVVDLCNKTEVTFRCLNGLVKNSDNSYSSNVPSGQVILLPDINLNISGQPFNIPAVQDSIITINGGIPPITVNQNGNDFDLIVPSEQHIKIGYNRPSKHQTTQYVKYDDGWKAINNVDPYVFNPTTDVLAMQDPTNWFKLLTNNAFGHKHRFTSINGGYYDFTTNQYVDVNGNPTTWNAEFSMGTNNPYIGYVIDHLTGLGWLTSMRGQQKYDPNLIADIDNLNATNYLGFNDWNLASHNELISIVWLNAPGNRGAVAKPYGTNLSPYFSLYQSMWSATTHNSLSTYQWCMYSYASYNTRNRTTIVQKAGLVRYHYT